MVELELAFPKLKFSAPVQPVFANDGSDRIFVVTQAGQIFVFPDDPDQQSAELFLDLRDVVARPGGDNGMFALAFHPQFRTNREFFVLYIDRHRPKSTVVARLRVSRDDPNRAERDSAEEILRIQQPFKDHNAACLQFGPDGMLYIALGDGGYNLKNRNAQDLSTLLGAMLRIDVDRRDEGLNYAIPPDNPFVGMPKARGEIWAYGLRAPWRFSFDRDTGECWLGDNGQVAFEEINLIQGGVNYGWMPREGFQAFDASRVDPRGRPAEAVSPTTDFRHRRNHLFSDPVFAYDHSKGKSVVGGFAYRGRRIPELIGAYIYADYAVGNIWAL